MDHSGSKELQGESAGLDSEGDRFGQMKGHGSKFARQQEEAIAALLVHRSIEEAARAVGITANTLLRWMAVPEFDAEYRKARRAAFGQAVARLQQMSGAAVLTLGKVLVEAGTPPSTRVRAAECILNHAAKAIEIEEIVARLTDLERAVKQRSE
jgi:hypothetical protein